MSNMCVLIERHPHVCFTQIDLDEVILLSSVNENFYHLNESAVELWLALETAKTLEELSQIFAQKYLEPPPVYQHDIWEWVQDAVKKGLLVLK